MFSFGDRVRWNTTGDDGWPLIRYGFVRSMAGPEVACSVTPISRAMMCASVVLPSPGGPQNRT